MQLEPISLEVFLKTNPSFKDLVRFHSSHKYFIYAKSHEAYKKLGSIVANHDKKDIQVVLQEYKKVFLQVAPIIPSSNNIYNVLLHMFGYFKHDLSKDQKDRTLNKMLEYKNGKLPLLEIIAILNDYVDKFGNTYLKQQKILKIKDEADFMV